jgi:hypothetical protein
VVLSGTARRGWVRHGKGSAFVQIIRGCHGINQVWSGNIRSGEVGRGAAWFGKVLYKYNSFNL